MGQRNICRKVHCKSCEHGIIRVLMPSYLELISVGEFQPSTPQFIEVIEKKRYRCPYCSGSSRVTRKVAKSISL